VLFKLITVTYLVVVKLQNGIGIGVVVVVVVVIQFLHLLPRQTHKVVEAIVVVVVV
jgi:hypothetical protein